jgi:hypothetical protein
VTNYTACTKQRGIDAVAGCGLSYPRAVVAEAKPHAVTIMHNNGLEADHIYKDINSVANGGGACWRCGTAHKVPKIEADRLVAG